MSMQIAAPEATGGSESGVLDHLDDLSGLMSWQGGEREAVLTLRHPSDTPRIFETPPGQRCAVSPSLHSADGAVHLGHQATLLLRFQRLSRPDVPQSLNKGQQFPAYQPALSLTISPLWRPRMQLLSPQTAQRDRRGSPSPAPTPPFKAQGF